MSAVAEVVARFLVSYQAASISRRLLRLRLSQLKAPAGTPTCITLLRWRRRAARSWLPRLPHEWHAEAAIWQTEANPRSAAPTIRPPKSRRASHRRCGGCRGEGRSAPDHRTGCRGNDVGRRDDRVPG